MDAPTGDRPRGRRERLSADVHCEPARWPDRACGSHTRSRTAAVGAGGPHLGELTDDGADQLGTAGFTDRWRYRRHWHNHQLAPANIPERHSDVSDVRDDVIFAHIAQSNIVQPNTVANRDDQLPHEHDDLRHIVAGRLACGNSAAFRGAIGLMPELPRSAQTVQPVELRRGERPAGAMAPCRRCASIDGRCSDAAAPGDWGLVYLTLFQVVLPRTVRVPDPGPARADPPAR